MRRSNFTLMELVAVLAVTSILVVMTIGAFHTDPTNAEQARIGGSVRFAYAKAVKESADVTVEFDGVTFILSYRDQDDNKIIAKQFTIRSGIEAKMERGGVVITSYTVKNTGTIDGGGNGVIFKIRKIGADKASVIWVNGFTSRVSYYDFNDQKVVTW